MSKEPRIERLARVIYRAELPAPECGCGDVDPAEGEPPCAVHLKAARAALNFLRHRRRMERIGAV